MSLDYILNNLNKHNIRIVDRNNNDSQYNGSGISSSTSTSICSICMKDNCIQHQLRDDIQGKYQ